MRDVLKKRRQLLLLAVGQLASLDYQVNMCANPKGYDFVQLTELIETTQYDLELETTVGELTPTWTAIELSALRDFEGKLDSELLPLFRAYERANTQKEIVESAAMERIRKAAQKCLSILQLDFTYLDLLNDY